MEVGTDYELDQITTALEEVRSILPEAVIELAEKDAVFKAVRVMTKSLNESSVSESYTLESRTFYDWRISKRPLIDGMSDVEVFHCMRSNINRLVKEAEEEVRDIEEDAFDVDELELKEARQALASVERMRATLEKPFESEEVQSLIAEERSFAKTLQQMQELKKVWKIYNSIETSPLSKTKISVLYAFRSNLGEEFVATWKRSYENGQPTGPWIAK